MLASKIYYQYVLMEIKHSNCSHCPDSGPVHPVEERPVYSDDLGHFHSESLSDETLNRGPVSV